jgi:hypothetical protein
MIAHRAVVNGTDLREEFLMEHGSLDPPVAQRTSFSLQMKKIYVPGPDPVGLCLFGPHWRYPAHVSQNRRMVVRTHPAAVGRPLKHLTLECGRHH